MASLTPQGRALIEASRRALRATPADRERIEGALRATLGVDALPHEGPAAPHAPRVGVSFATKAVVAAGLVGAVALVVLVPRASTPPPRPPLHVLPAPQAIETAVTEPLREPPPPAPESRAFAPVAPAPPPSTASAPRRQDPLAQEVALLSRATSALRLGRTQEALGALAAHQRRFPNGSLAEERRAAKAQALCLLGRTQEGRVELGQLDPRSPAAARAAQDCADAASPAKAP